MGGLCAKTTSVVTPRGDTHANERYDDEVESYSEASEEEEAPRSLSANELLANMRKKSKVNLSNSFIGRMSSNEDLLSENRSPTKSTGNMRISEEELRKILEGFRTNCNSRNSDTIDKTAYFETLEKTLESRFDLYYFQTVFSAFEVDGTGTVDLVEIATGLSNLLQLSDKDAMIRIVFGLFDTHGSNSIEVNEMIQFFTKSMTGNSKMSGYKITPTRLKALTEHLARIFDATDVDKNGRIDYDEFITAVSDADNPLGMLFLSMQGDQ
jgi:Ca2+-binding EF-hand superfamily protein